MASTFLNINDIQITYSIVACELQGYDWRAGGGEGRRFPHEALCFKFRLAYSKKFVT